MDVNEHCVHRCRGGGQVSSKGIPDRLSLIPDTIDRHMAAQGVDCDAFAAECAFAIGLRVLQPRSLRRRLRPAPHIVPAWN